MDIPGNLSNWQIGVFWLQGMKAAMSVARGACWPESGKRPRLLFGRPAEKMSYRQIEVTPHYKR